MKKVIVSLLWIVALSLCGPAYSDTQTVTLVGTTYPTFVEDGDETSRYTAIVEDAFSRLNTSVDIKVMRQAFLGSALRSGKADGHVAFMDLDERDADRLYSIPYARAELYLASRNESVTTVSQFSFIANERVATENRFANTAQLRPLEGVRWSRNPTTFDVFKQIGDDRAEYIFADKRLIDEFNRMLSAANRPPLYFSPNPLITTTLHISLPKSLDNAQAIMAAFNQQISAMEEDGTLTKLLLENERPTEVSLLEVGRYKQMIRNW